MSTPEQTTSQSYKLNQMRLKYGLQTVADTPKTDADASSIDARHLAVPEEQNFFDSVVSWWNTGTET